MKTFITTYVLIGAGVLLLTWLITVVGRKIATVTEDSALSEDMLQSVEVVERETNKLIGCALLLIAWPYLVVSMISGFVRGWNMDS